MPSDLELAQLLADAADVLTLLHFRSADLQVEIKGDGTPVTEVDMAVEVAMQALVRQHRPEDAFLGEEIGASGTGNRRWIFDGIDGTHNFASGKLGWGTMIALEVDGAMEVGVVSSPATNQRWWGSRGAGSWTGPIDDPAAAPTRMKCSEIAVLEDAIVMASPPAGFLVGWRSDAADRLNQGDAYRHRSFALDIAGAATGDHDAIVILVGGPWDFAAHIAIYEEAGGEFRSLWNDRRLDTYTAVFAPPAIIDEIVARVADLIPDTPDEPLRAIPLDLNRMLKRD